MSQVSDLIAAAERLRGRAPKGLVRFLCVGIVGLATHAGVFTLLYHLGVAKSPAWFAGLAAGTAVTWQLNRRMTFAATGRRRIAEVLRYGLVTVVAQGVSYTVFRSACALDPALPPTLALFVGAVIATLFSYSGQRFFTFAPPKSPSDIEPAAAQELPIA